MGNRKVPFVIGEYYHVYNRGIEKREIFMDKDDMSRFLESMQEFNTVKPIGSLAQLSRKKVRGSTAEKLVNIVAYCLNPNHFHILLEEITEGGISEFMKRLQGGYTWYFNNKYKRVGSLLQGKFKSSHINTNAYLLHVSVYINLNYKVHKLSIKKHFCDSSFPSFINKSPEVEKSLCSGIEIILDQFTNVSEYKKYAQETLPDIMLRKQDETELQDMLME